MTLPSHRGLRKTFSSRAIGLAAEHMAFIHVTFAMLMSTAVCYAVATLASALLLHIQLFVIMVDVSDQVHFLTHTRDDLLHGLLILTLVLLIASVPFGHLLVYGLYHVCYLGLLSVVFTGWIYWLTLYFRTRAADGMRHKYQLAAAELGRGSVGYVREVLTQQLLRRYLRIGPGSAGGNRSGARDTGRTLADKDVNLSTSSCQSRRGGNTEIPAWRGDEFQQRIYISNP